MPNGQLLPELEVSGTCIRGRRELQHGGEVEDKGDVRLGDSQGMANRVLQQDERHSYEKCQYEEFKLRVKKMDEIRAEKGGERSN
jgi:hypothetical protein